MINDNLMLVMQKSGVRPLFFYCKKMAGICEKSVRNVSNVRDL